MTVFQPVVILHGSPAAPSGEAGRSALNRFHSVSSTKPPFRTLYHRAWRRDNRVPQFLGTMASMASTTPTKPSARRTASQPVQRRASGFETDIETLYNHPSARIISFTTVTRQAPSPSSSSKSPQVEEEPGTLLWVSRTERTIAVGTYSSHRAAVPLC